MYYTYIYASHKRTNTTQFYSHGTYSSQNHRERKQKGDCQELQGWENGKLLFKGHRVSIQEDQIILEVNGGDGSVTM